MSTRRLVAILFADVVGYTALMQHDENKALSHLNIFRSEIEHKVPDLNGEIIQFYGDGCLAIFDNAVDAVSCAKVLQEGFFLKFDLPVRIGLHAGDVLFKGENIFGNAVNIASRVESMGVPGAILLSESIRNQIKNQAEFDLESLGKFAFKNVEEDIEVYALANDGFPLPKPEQMKGKGKQITESPRTRKIRILNNVQALGLWAFLIALSIILVVSFNQRSASTALSEEEMASIVVLPFDGIGSDADKVFFASGIADEIRTTLSSIDKLKVISRTSSLYFKDNPAPSDVIAQTLGVDHILSGSVQRNGDQFKVNIELSNTDNDEVIWTMKTKEKPISDIFSVQEEIAEEVSIKLRVDLQNVHLSRYLSPPKNDPELYAQFLQVYRQMYEIDPRIVRENEAALSRIIEAAPNYTAANKALMGLFVLKAVLGMPIDSARKLMKPLREKTRKLDPDNRILPGLEAYNSFFFEWDFPKTIQIAQKGTLLNDEESFAVMIDYYSKVGDLESAYKTIQAAEQVNPLHGLYKAYKGNYYILTGRYQEAEPLILKTMAEYGAITAREGLQYIIRLYLLQERYEEAIGFGEQGQKNFGFYMPYFSGYLAIAHHKLGKIDDFERVMQEIEDQYDAGISGSPAYFLAAAYCNIGELDIGFEWLERSFDANDIEITWLKMDPAFEPVKDDPRYQKMLERVGFP